MYDIITPIISISFYAIILRISLVHPKGRSQGPTLISGPQEASVDEENVDSDRMPSNTSLPWTSRKSINGHGHRERVEVPGSGSFALKRIQVHVTQESFHESEVISVTRGSKAAIAV